MIMTVWIFLFIFLSIVLAFNRASLAVASIAYFMFLLFVSVFSHLSAISLSILWIFFLTFVITFNISFLRRLLITRYLLTFYQKKIPHISKTEEDALKAGTVDWEGELLSGVPNWDKFQSLSKVELSIEENEFMRTEVTTLCAMIDDFEINQTAKIPVAILEYLKTKKFFGLIIPKKYGGKEFSALGHSQIISKIASVSTSVATVVSVPNSLGPAELLLHYGTEEQKNYYLPRLAHGEEIPCFALTSPIAGSDASSIVDSGIICRGNYQGKEQIGILLNWNKRYITLSPIATLIGLAFKLYDPDHLLGEKVNIGISCALIPVDTSGVITGRRHLPLRSSFPNGPTQGKNVFVPLDFLIGGPNMAGHGWQMLMETLAAGRSISLPSLVAGSAKRAMYATGIYARIRDQFNTYIGAFGGIQEVLTRMVTNTYMLEALRLFTIKSLDRGAKPAVASAISKCYATELGRSVIMDAMDIHGGKGICMGPHNYLAQSYIEAPISITVEGANILTRSLIIFGQGLMRCHPYILPEITAAKNNDLKEFDHILFKHAGHLLSSIVRAPILALSCGKMTRAPKNILRSYYQKLSQYSAALAYLTELALFVFGGELKRKEQMSARFGDLLSYLYIGSAVLKYYEENNYPNALLILKGIFIVIFARLEEQIKTIIANFPSSILKSLLFCKLLPYRSLLKTPSDRLSGKISQFILTPGFLRDQFAADIYTAPTAHNPIGQLPGVLSVIIAAEPLFKKLHDAVAKKLIFGKNFSEQVYAAQQCGILTENEAQQLVAAEEARMTVIQVDDFG